jgi:uncharacterized membrane protein (UPF0136 family)
MSGIMVAVGITNLVLCIVIVVMGIVGYTRTKTRSPLYVGIAFGLIGVYHLLMLLGFGHSLSVLLVIVIFISYGLVIYSLYRPNLDDLQKLAALKSKGIITEEEYVIKKKQILGS